MPSAPSAISQSKVTSKGQVTVPEAIREQLHLQAGDRLDWEPQADGSVRVRKLGGQLGALAGMLARPGKTVTLKQMDQGIGSYLRDKHRARR